MPTVSLQQYEECLVIVSSNAVVEPKTVVVEFLHTAIAFGTVLRP